MHVAYIVIAHQFPRQIARLIGRLQSDSTSFYVHLDAKAPASTTREVAAVLAGWENIEFLRRFPCYWGDFGVVEAAIEGVRRALDGPNPADVLVVLSGQDYPLLSPEMLREFFAGHRGASFIDFNPLPDFTQFPDTGGLHLYEDWHIVRSKMWRVRVPFYRRRPPLKMSIYKGSAFWQLTAEHARYVIDLMATRPNVAKFFRYTLLPDEITFQTILANSTHRDALVNRAVHYVDWNGSDDPSHPKVLTIEDLPAITASDALFARKVHPVASAELLDALDSSAAW